jgi:hypothetical protein
VNTLLTLIMFAVLSFQDPPDFQLFSGSWDGDQILVKHGACSIGGGGRVSAGIRLQVTVSSDGSLSARVFMDGRKEPIPETWTGRIDSGLAVTVIAPNRSFCRGQERQYTNTFTGKLTQKKGRYELRMEADDVACPNTNCAFKNRVVVRKK